MVSTTPPPPPPSSVCCCCWASPPCISFMCRLKLDAVILLLHWGQTLLVSLVSFLCILTGAAGGAVVLVVVVVVVVSKILFFFFWNDSLPAVMSLDRGGDIAW